MCVAIAAAVVTRAPVAGHQPSAPAPRKQVLAWADVRNGYQHFISGPAYGTITDILPPRQLRIGARFAF